MLRSIGIRVAPKFINFTVCEKKEDGSVKIIAIEKIVVPIALKQEKKLSYIRTTLLSIFTEFKIDKAGIRITESVSMTMDIFRVYLEGVIQELLATCNIQNYFLATLNSIASYLEEQTETIKGFISGDDTLVGVTLPKSKETRESVLTALAAINL
jgi:hypothetical protein